MSNNKIFKLIKDKSNKNHNQKSNNMFIMLKILTIILVLETSNIKWKKNIVSINHLNNYKLYKY